MLKLNASSLVKLLLVFLTVALLACFTYTPIQNNMNLGLDLKGGLHVVMEAKEKPGQEVTSDTMQKTISVLRNRIDKWGVSEPIIQAQGNRRVIVDLPGVKNPDHVAAVIGQTAKLEFQDKNGRMIVTGANLKDARAEIIPQSGDPGIALEFDNEGAAKFGEFTTNNVGESLYIYLDGIMQGSPSRIEEPIPNGQALMHGGGIKTMEEANETAIMLRSGALPVTLDIVEKRTVGPTLGMDSLFSSVKAGIVGLMAISIFMAGYYRLPGVVADISLVLYSMLVLGTMVLLGATLTLPGIAAFILSIGMAVDSNIIIFERIKEEVRSGKTLKAAIDAGFRRAFLTIIDSHVTTLITALVLMYFGTGPIKGFAVTLTIGIIASLFTAVTFSQSVLKLLADLVTKPKFYGV
ncbi:MAG: protein translocase subunit SecD [Acidobacteriota bacterium]